MNLKNRANKILKLLRKSYPDAKISLNYSNTFELLIAVMLSAQTTDKQVNKVTEKLFPKYRGRTEKQEIEKFANADIKSLERDINSIGLFRTKAKNIKKISQLILSNFDGNVPRSMTELITLPGVGRKTANVVLSKAYGINEGIAVDTHVKRLAYQLRLTKEKDQSKIEKDLMKIFKRRDWSDVTTLLIAHGRKKNKSLDLFLDKIKS